MKISRNEGFAMAAIGVIAFLGYKLYKSDKALKDKKAEYNTDLEQLKDDMRDEIYSGIKDEVLNEAIDKAVSKKVSDILYDAKNESIRAAKNQLSSTVTAEVSATWSRIKGNVEADLLNKVGTIDVTEIKREATEKARDKALSDASKAIDDVVDDIRKKYESRTDSALRKQEEKFEKKANETLSSLRDRYQNKLWDQLLNL